MVAAVVAPPPPEPDVPLRVGGSVKAPVAIIHTPPVYPEIAKRARVSGVVVIEAIIDKQGRVKNAKILRGLPMGLDQSALDALKQWTFHPATLDGRPVEVFYVLTINFALRN